MFTGATVSIASNKGQTNQQENENPAVQGQSQGLNNFLAQLAGAYDTENKGSELNKYSADSVANKGV
jgi:hypothetical protein